MSATTSKVHILKQPHAAAVRPHDVKPLRGLPEEPLPTNERILWQGAPDWRALAISAFHARQLAIYFSVICALRAGNILSSGGSVSAAAIAVLWLLPLALAAIAMLVLMAWLTSRTTVYTITNKRVILHIGVVLDLTLNLPFDAIEQAGLKVADKRGTGDLPLVLRVPNKIAYVHLWPHARPWKIGQPEPMLRSIPAAAEVGILLAQALDEHVCKTGPILQIVKPSMPAPNPAATVQPQTQPMVATS